MRGKVNNDSPLALGKNLKERGPIPQRGQIKKKIAAKAIRSLVSIMSSSSSSRYLGTPRKRALTPQSQQANVYYMPPSLTYTKRRAIRRKPQKLFAKCFNDGPSPLSPAQTIVLFYSAINEKNMKQLDAIIAEDCFFDDFSFPKPFQGKKEVMHFLEQLIMCMGQNMQFNIEHICRGEDNSVGVNWHLGTLPIFSPLRMF
ncbi:nuclear transport factor 2 family protein [Striga asiatica]|uniref:Nuclear transport factor 2 family protein n=1 Tax=Striga asiatica TaxID=4170 RepID=A0A5A7PEV4_STRAF|nr:nuclear transport factor 2 family protein [Striga asiatica]